MNPRQVTVLWIIAVALGLAVALVKINQQSSANTATDRSPGETLLATFPGAEVATVALTDATQTITLKKQGEVWTVVERDDYPARTPNVLALLRTIGDLKIAQTIEAGPSFAPSFGMDENAKTPDERGITAVFSDASGKEIAHISAGRILDNGGRFVRNHADESGFYSVSDMLTMLDADPVRWLDESFIRPEKISAIHVAEAANPSVKLWHVSRESEDGDFALADGAPGETLDSEAGDGFKRLLSFARFSDVVPAAKVESRTADAAAARVVTIETFEGFTYTLTLAPATSEEEADAAEPEQILTVSVDATLPSERKKTEDESEEVTAELDAAFTERHKALTEKLGKEKALAGRTFVVSRSLVESLLVNRDDITTGPPEPAPAPEVQAPPTPPMPPVQRPNPGGGTSVTTPPIQIPPLPTGDEGDE